MCAKNSEEARVAGCENKTCTVEGEAGGVTGARPCRALQAALRTSAFALSEGGAIRVRSRGRTGFGFGFYKWLLAAE